MLATLTELVFLVAICFSFMIPVAVLGAGISWLIEYFSEKERIRIHRELFPEE